MASAEHSLKNKPSTHESSMITAASKAKKTNPPSLNIHIQQWGNYEIIWDVDQPSMVWNEASSALVFKPCPVSVWPQHTHEVLCTLGLRWEIGWLNDNSETHNSSSPRSFIFEGKEISLLFPNRIPKKWKVRLMLHSLLWINLTSHSWALAESHQTVKQAAGVQSEQLQLASPVKHKT